MKQFLNENCRLIESKPSFDLDKLEIFTDNKNISIIENYQLNSNQNINLLFVSTHSSINDFDQILNNDNYENVQLWTVLTSVKHFEHTFVKRETVKDRIIDVFLKQDINFEEDKKFSDSYFVYSNSKEAKQYFSEATRQEMLKLKDANIIVELYSNYIFVGTERNYYNDASLIDGVIQLLNTF
jgi:hypothetical protein